MKSTMLMAGAMLFGLTGGVSSLALPGVPGAMMAAQMAGMGGMMSGGATAGGVMVMPEQMRAGMISADTRLDELVATMKAATGEARMDAIEALLAALVDDRKTMADSMMQMHRAPGSQATTGMMGSGMMPGGMMAMPEQMRAGMTSADTHLDELVAQMKAATGDARIDAIEQLLTALVDSHTMMAGSMMRMHHGG